MRAACSKLHTVGIQRVDVAVDATYMIENSSRNNFDPSVLPAYFRD